MSTITVAAVAYQGTFDVDLNVKTHIDQLDELAGAGADLIVFPEISLQGYPAGIDRFSPIKNLESYQNAERVPDGPNVQKILAHAAELGVHVVFGLTELEDEIGAVYNTLVLGGPDGYIGSYRKVHLGLTEAAIWRHGNDWPVFDTAIGKIGMAICYDLRWPESTRELTLRGAEIIVHSAATPAVVFEGPGSHPIARHCDTAIVRAAENNRWIVTTNFGGNLGEITFGGGARIVAPNGRIVATAPLDEVGVAMAEIDVKAGIAEANAAVFGARLVRDRRPETYLAFSGAITPSIDA